jgi:hypothetical protein
MEPYIAFLSKLFPPLKRYVERKTLRRLEEVLAGEQVIASVQASLSLTRHDRVAMTLYGNYREYVRTYGGPLVVTESRLIFVGRTLTFGSSGATQLNEISSMNLNSGFPQSQLWISRTDSGVLEAPFLIKTEEAKPFFAAAQDALARAHGR